MSISIALQNQMFTDGQIIFAVLFFVVFVTLITIMYIKDKRLHKKNYKGVKWILIGFISFIVLLFVIKLVLKNG